MKETPVYMNTFLRTFLLTDKNRSIPDGSDGWRKYCATTSGKQPNLLKCHQGQSSEIETGRKDGETMSRCQLPNFADMTKKLCLCKTHRELQFKNRSKIVDIHTLLYVAKITDVYLKKKKSFDDTHLMKGSPCSLEII